jgi:hypothetical protein
MKDINAKIDIEGRIELLEEGLSVPGTVLSRCLLSDGPGWVLSIGNMNMPKNHYYAHSIESVFEMAEKERESKNENIACG